MTAVAALWIGAFLSLGICIPLGRICIEIGTAGSWHLLFDPSVLSVVKITLWQASVSTGISGVLGLVLGLFIGKVLSQRKGILPATLQNLLAIPYAVPSVVAAASWVSLLGKNGLLSQAGILSDWAYSMKAVILAHVFFNIPFVALMVAEARKGISTQLLNAAKSLGAGRISEFRFIIWPQVKWVFASACVQVLSLCVMSFALVLILGGGPPVDTLETRIYERLRYGSLDISGAAAFAVWEVSITLIPWLVILALQGRQAFGQSSQFGQSRPQERRHLFSLLALRSPLKNPSFATYFTEVLCFVISVLFIAPYLVTLIHGVSGILGLFKNSENISSVPSAFNALPAMSLSIQIAISTGFLALLTGGAAVILLQALRPGSVLRTLIGSILALPAGISVLVLGLGVWLAYSHWIDPFEGSLAAIIGLQTVLFFPLCLRILWPVSVDTQKRLLEVSTTLGATAFQAFRFVEWPRWRGPILSCFAIVSAASLGEVGAVSLFYSEKLIPVPLLISRWMERYHFESAQGLSALLLGVSCLIVVASGRLREQTQ